MKWERNTVSLPVRLLFRKRRIFLPDKWNSWSNAREWDNAERMRWFSHTCGTSVLSFSRSDLDDSSARLDKKGSQGQKSVIASSAAMHACTYREVTWCVIRCRLFGAQDIIRVRAYTLTHPTERGEFLSFSLFFRSLFSPTTEIRAQANDSIHSVGFHS